MFKQFWKKLIHPCLYKKPYLRFFYIESNFDEGLRLKNHCRSNCLKDPISIREAASKCNADTLFNDPSILKNIEHSDFNDKNLNNVRFVKVNSKPAVGEHLTAKYYVDNSFYNSVGASWLLKLKLNEKLKQDEEDHITRNSILTSPKSMIEIPTKVYVDSLSENDRSRRDLSAVFNNQDNEFDTNKLTILDSLTVNRFPTTNIELSITENFDKELDENSILRFNQTPQNYSEVSIGDAE